MTYPMDDFVCRVFMNSLTGSYELLIKNRFASHVTQMPLIVTSDTIAHDVCLSRTKGTGHASLSYCASQEEYY